MFPCALERVWPKAVSRSNFATALVGREGTSVCVPFFCEQGTQSERNWFFKDVTQQGCSEAKGMKVIVSIPTGGLTRVVIDHFSSVADSRKMKKKRIPFSFCLLELKRWVQAILFVRPVGMYAVVRVFLNTLLIPSKPLCARGGNSPVTPCRFRSTCNDHWVSSQTSRLVPCTQSCSHKTPSCTARHKTSPWLLFLWKKYAIIPKEENSPSSFPVFIWCRVWKSCGNSGFLNMKIDFQIPKDQGRSSTPNPCCTHRLGRVVLFYPKHSEWRKSTIVQRFVKCGRPFAPDLRTCW